MGSESDFAIMKAACEVLNDFGVSSHVEVVSAHRHHGVLLNLQKVPMKNSTSLLRQPVARPIYPG